MSTEPIVRNLQRDMDPHWQDVPERGSWAGCYAARIVGDPQAHIDALCEAGVLMDIWRGAYQAGGALYTIVEPEPVKREPCKTEWVGRIASEFCDECDHVLLAHTHEHVCSVCESVDDIQRAKENLV